MALKSHNKLLEDKTFSQISFGCSRKEGVPVINETDLKFTKTSL